MKHYSFFIGLALLIHGIVFIPLWWSGDLLTPLTGGGAGGGIYITVSSVPKALEGKRKQNLSPRPSRGTFDKGSAAQSGSGQGQSAGPDQGAGSGKSGNDETLAKIRRRIERAKRYPLLARRQGLQGTANVAFRISDDGSAQDIRLVQSSGIAPLDQAALATIRRAAPFPSYADPIQIGIRFTLSQKSE